MSYLTPVSADLQEFNRAVSQADLDRFLFYSRRIVTLSHSHAYWVTHSISAADELRDAFLAKGSGGTLFPKLRSLKLGCHKSWEWINSVLLVPTISTLRLEYEDLAPNDFASLLLYITDFCKDIRAITFDMGEADDNGDGSDALTRYFSQTQMLRQVSCCLEPSPNVLDQLSRLPQLEMMTVGCFENPLLQLPDLPLPSASRFPALRDLTVLSLLIETAKESLKAFNLPLKRLAFIYDTEGVDGLPNLLEEIEHRYGSGLEELVISMNGTAEQQAAPWNERMITPFCSCMPRLTSLRLRSAPDMPFDDCALATLGKELPHLRVLHLSTSRSGSDYTPRATLVGLFDLLSSCRNLVELRIDLDARGTQTYTSLPSSGLRALELGWSPIDADEVQDLAELFSEALPMLEILHMDSKIFGGADEDVPDIALDYTVRWGHVAERMETLRRVRREEQKQFEGRIVELEK
jgi:hypothetical protein